MFQTFSFYYMSVWRLTILIYRRSLENSKVEVSRWYQLLARILNRAEKTTLKASGQAKPTKTPKIVWYLLVSCCLEGWAIRWSAVWLVEWLGKFPNKNTKCPIDAPCHRHRRKDLMITKYCKKFCMKSATPNFSSCPHAGKSKRWILSCECFMNA